MSNVRPNRIIATPRARAQARSADVDLALLTGSGPNGRIVAADVQRYLRSGGAGAGPRAGGRNSDHLVARMLTQTAPVPVMSLQLECDVTAAVADGVSPQEWVAWSGKTMAAFATALSDTGHGSQPVALVVANDEGLLALNMGQIDQVVAGVNPASGEAAGLGEAYTVARAGRASVEQLQAAPFAFHHVGVFDVEIAAPLLLEPVQLLLTQGAIQQRPGVVDGRVEPRWMTTLIATFDLRSVSVEQASLWLTHTAAGLTTGAGVIA